MFFLYGLKIYFTLNIQPNFTIVISGKMCKMSLELENLYIYFLYLTQKILKANN